MTRGIVRKEVVTELVDFLGNGCREEPVAHCFNKDRCQGGYNEYSSAGKRKIFCLSELEALGNLVDKV